MKKTVYWAAGLCAVCFLSAISLSAAEGDKPKTPRERKAPAAVLEKFDKNKNGVLDPEEKEAAKKERETARPPRANKAEMLKKFDKDGDGKLDETERAAAREETRKNAPKRGEKKEAAEKPAEEKK